MPASIQIFWALPLANYIYIWNVFSESCIPDSTIPASLQLVLPSGLCSCRKDTLHTFHGTLYANCLWLESYGPEEVSSHIFLCFCSITSLLSPHTLNVHFYKFFTLKEGCILHVLAIFTHTHKCRVCADMCASVHRCVYVHPYTDVCMCMCTRACVRGRGEGSVILKSSYWYVHQWTILWQNLSVLPYFITSLLCVSTLHTLSCISFFTWSFYLMLIFIFQGLKGILLSFVRNSCTSVTYPIFM